MPYYKISPAFDLIIEQNEEPTENKSEVVQYTQKMFRTGFHDAFVKFKSDSFVCKFIRESCANCSFRIGRSQEEPTKFTLTKTAVSLGGQRAEQCFSFVVEKENGRFWIKQTDRKVSFFTLGAFFTHFLVLEIFEKQAKRPIATVAEDENSLEALKMRLISHETLKKGRW